MHLVRALFHRIVQAPPELARKTGVVDHDIRLAREQQAHRVYVRGADGRPAVVDHCDFGVHETAAVLMDLDAGGEKSTVESARRVMQQHVLDAAPVSYTHL